LGELTRFFLYRWHLSGVLRMNFMREGYQSEEAVLRFFHGSSRFYPEFDDLLRYRVRKWFKREVCQLKRRNEASV